MYTITLILITIFALIIFFLLINLKWCVKTLREIASPRNQGGYTKLVQIILITLLCSVFVVILIHYLLNPGQVDRVDLVLTVIVGWLGAIIGRFFGERAMENLEERRRLYATKLNLKLDQYQNFIESIFPELKKK